MVVTERWLEVGICCLVTIRDGVPFVAGSAVTKKENGKLFPVVVLFSR